MASFRLLSHLLEYKGSLVQGDLWYRLPKEPTTYSATEQVFVGVFPSYNPYSDPEIGNLHTCNDCGDKFLFKSSLSIHRDRTSIRIQYYCKECLCNLEFENRCKFLCHLREHSNDPNNTNFKDVRPKISVNVVLLNKVKKLAEDSLLGANTSQEGGIDEWKGEFQTEQNSNCSTSSTSGFASGTRSCGSSTSSKSGLHSPDEPKEPTLCPECHKVIDTTLVEHFWQSNKQLNPHYCKKCKLSFPTNCCLQVHKRIHNKIRPYVCPECCCEFQGWNAFCIHVSQICLHWSRIKRFVCSECNALCKLRGSLIQHCFIEHSSDEFYSCNNCAFTAVDKSIIIKHFCDFEGNFNTKCGSPSYSRLRICNMCSAKLPGGDFYEHVFEHCRSPSLQRYLFRCEVCLKIFATKEHYLRHQNMGGCKWQNGVKPTCEPPYDSVLQFEAESPTSHSVSPKSDTNVSNTSVVKKTTDDDVKKLKFAINGKSDNSSLTKPTTNPGSTSNSITDKSSGKHSSVIKLAVNSSRVGNTVNHPKELKIFERVVDAARATEENGRTVKTLVGKISGDEIVVGVQPTPRTTDDNRRVIVLSPTSVIPTDKDGRLVKPFKKLIKTENDYLIVPQGRTEYGTLCRSNKFACRLCNQVVNLENESFSDHFTIKHKCSKQFISELKKRAFTPQSEPVSKNLTNANRKYFDRNMSNSKHSPDKKPSEREFTSKHSKSLLKTFEGKSDIINFSDVLDLSHVKSTRQEETRTTKQIKTYKSLHSSRLETSSVSKLANSGRVIVPSSVSCSKSSCARCSFETENKDVFLRHLESHRSPGDYLCTECGLCFVVKPSLKKHLLICHQIRNVQSVSGKKQKAMSVETLKLEKHKPKRRKIDDGPSKYSAAASASDDESVNCGQVIFPVNVSDKPKSLSCLKCSFVAVNEDAFKTHLKDHRSNDDFQCMECGVCFVVKPSLKKHLLICHQIKEFDVYLNDNDCCNVRLEESIGEDSETPEPAKQVEEIPPILCENQCSICLKICESSLILSNHFRTHGMAYLRSKIKT